MVTLTIDGRTVSVPEGTTILEAAQTLRISIPTLCYLKDINEIGACRICMVEVEGYARLVPSCDSAVSEGMVVYTSSPRVREARRVNLRLLLSQHETKCTKCTRSGNCKLQQLTNDYNLLGDHYIDDLKNIPTDYSNPVVRIENRCVKCMRCIQVCEKIQGMGIWDLMGTGTRTTVGVAHTRTLGESDCTFCGQCITHCPVGGLQEHDDTGKVFDALANKDRITVVQVAPAVRAAWAEFYHLDPKFATAERMVTALKTMGFDYVFDTDFAADLTIMEEGSEFIERFTHRNKYHWPMFTSCCPGWVRFLKGQFPSYTENLSTAKSPQQMFGAVAKSYFAQKIGVDPKKLFVVSIMPCTAKKAECALPTMKDEQGDPDVDVVLTTREIVRMLRGEQINPAVLPETPFDSPLGTGTGAAVVFGATGGVMDAALRSAYYLITGKEPKPDAFSAVRGMDSWKEAVFTIPGAGNVRVAVVSGLGNTRKLMHAIDEGDVDYDFVEVMAFPGGGAGRAGAGSISRRYPVEHRQECQGAVLPPEQGRAGAVPGIPESSAGRKVPPSAAHRPQRLEDAQRKVKGRPTRAFLFMKRLQKRTAGGGPLQLGLLTHGCAAVGAELAVACGAADGADLEGHLGLVHRRLVLPGLAGLQLGDTLLAGVDGSHHVLDGVGDVALVLRHEPFADGAVVLLNGALLAILVLAVSLRVWALSAATSARSLALSTAMPAYSCAFLLMSLRIPIVTTPFHISRLSRRVHTRDSARHIFLLTPV